MGGQKSLMTSVKELDFTPQGEVFPSPHDWREGVP